MVEPTDGITPRKKKSQPKKHTSKIEETKKKLYSKYAEVKERPRSTMHPHKNEAADDWNSDDEEVRPQDRFSNVKTGAPIFRKVFIGAAIFFGVALILAVISLFGGRNVVSTNAIEMEILTKSFVDGGETFDVTVSITNRNSAPLELADLIFEYPKSSVADGEVQRERRTLNTIRPGQTVLEDFQATLFGEEGDERRILATLEYRVQGSNAIFVREAETLIAVQSTPVRIVLDAPDNVINNQPVTLDIDINSNSTTVTQNMLMRVEYPPGFRFDEASPEPSLSNNIWILGDLEPGASRNINITGTVRGQTGEERTFRAFVGEQDPQDEKEIITAFNSAIHVIGINLPFIGANVTIDGSADDQVAITSGVTSRVDVEWTNTLPVRLTDVEVTASLSGSAYDPNNVSARRGFFDSVNNEVRWSKDVDPDFASIEPGESGTLQFEFIPRPLVSGSQVINQPEVVIDVNVRGIDPSGNVQEASGVNRKVAQVNSDFQLTPKTLYFSGPFGNTGNYPPQAGASTTFTVAWRVTNSSNTIDDAKVTTTLPSYVEWTNTFSPNTENLSYNSVKREITWDLGDVNSGAGFTGAAREVFFQVSITPSVSQVSQIPLLTNDVILSGDDRFTGVFLRNVRRGHTTSLLNDVQPGNGSIQP